MTKEQRKRWISLLTRMRDEAAKTAHLDSNADETRANYDALIAILSDESEADRKLGAAVRDCFNGVTPKKAARIANTIASECEVGSFSEMVFSVIAEALKEEDQR